MPANADYTVRQDELCGPPVWGPLERAVTLALCPSDEIEAVCAEFMYMYESPAGIQNYKHRDTRKYFRLAGDETAPACVRDLAEARRF